MTKAHGILSMQAVENCLKNRKNPKGGSDLPPVSAGSNTGEGHWGFHNRMVKILYSM